MFRGLDETAADIPVRDLPSRLASDLSANQNARVRQDVSRVSREELEDRFLRVHEETLVLKRHVHKQEDKIKKLGTKLMRLVKDRGRMEQLALGGGGQAVCKQRDVEMEELMEELQEKVRSLQAENEGMKRRLLVAKQQLINSHSRRAAPYGRIPSRVNSGLKKLRDDSSPLPQAPPKCRSWIQESRSRKPPTGLLPRFGHSLLEEARAEVRNLESVLELQRSHMEEVQAAAEQLREELRRKEAQHQERLLQAREQQTSRLRSHVTGNVEMIRLQKQMFLRTERTAELEGRFLGLQESQRALKVAHEAAMLKVDQLSAQLKDERMRSLDLEERLQSGSISRLKERISELEQERDLLKDNNDKLVHRASDGCRQQRTQIQEQQLKLQIAQLEAALKADLVDKNEILDKIKAERDTNEKLTEENRELHLQTVEQKQQMEELQDRLKFCSREELHKAELTEALLLMKVKSQKSGDLCFLQEVEAGGVVVGSELRAAHAETIQELQKTRNLLSMEARISKDYQAELQAVLKKMEANKVTWEQQLERQAALLDSRAAKIQRLEAQLRDVAYGTKPSSFQPVVSDEDECEEESLRLGGGENLLELQVVGATLSPSALQALGDEPSTFCTYAFYLFEPHATPVATGRTPTYGFTSKYVVMVDERLLDFLRGGSVTVELHQALGLDWRTLASGRLGLQQLLQQDGRVYGTVPLVGVSEETRSFGSVDYWLRLKLPVTETVRLYKEKLNHPQQVLAPPASWNELSITVHLCRDLKKSGGSGLPSPYVVYKFYDFPDYPTATVHDCCNPPLDDLKSYSVPVDVDLDRYLRTEALQLYVFDDKEEQMDAYVGKSRVPLLPLTRDQGITGAFQLTDPSGLAAGLIEVTLKWRSTYVPPSAAIVASEEEEEDDEALQEEDKHPVSIPEACRSKVGRRGETSCALDHRQEEEDESHFSEGQLVPLGCRSHSDDSDVSEDIVEGDETYTVTEEYKYNVSPPSQPSQRVRVEVVSLSLRPESRVSRDGSVVRLFVEYSLLDLPTEETPLALPKPPQGQSINYNYSKVVPVDSENNGPRRQLLRRVLQGRNPPMERIRFTVVSEPPEAEEQERECEDVGVAFIRIPEILERHQDLTETSLEVVDVEDSSQVVGSLVVTVEGLEAMQAIMEDRDQDHIQDQERTLTKLQAASD
uniref:RPGRIP1 like n=1 Tax=Cyclopterus lumpus TaxID=8103 RepID=A0A8C3AZT3_CYCLU